MSAQAISYRDAFPKGKVVTLVDSNGSEWKFVVVAVTKRGLALRLYKEKDSKP